MAVRIVAPGTWQMVASSAKRIGHKCVPRMSVVQAIRSAVYSSLTGKSFLKRKHLGLYRTGTEAHRVVRI